MYNFIAIIRFISKHLQKYVNCRLSRLASWSSGEGTSIVIQSDYGYIILVGVASGFLLTWQAIQVESE